MLRSRFSAVLFDLDGTLIDGYPAIAASVNALLADHGVPAMSIEQIKPYVGRGLGVMLQALIPKSDMDRDVAAYRRYYERLMYDGTFLLPGGKSLLSALAKAETKLGICSNKLATFTERLLRHLDILQYFRVVLGPEHVVYPKPAPDMLVAAAQRLNESVERFLYIGDMSVDVEAGKAAGMTVWVVATGSESIETLNRTAADRVFHDLVEIQKELFGSDA